MAIPLRPNRIVPVGSMAMFLETDKLQEIGSLPVDEHGKCGDCGEGRCAFSSDQSYFAYCCSFREVTIIPWRKLKQYLYASNEQHKRSSQCDFVNDQISIDTGYEISCLAFGIGKADNKVSAEERNYWTMFDCSYNYLLATGHVNGRIRLWNPESGKLLLELYDHKHSVSGLAFRPDHSPLLSSSSEDGTVKVWDLSDDGNMFKTLKDTKTKYQVKNIVWSPNSKLLCSVGQQHRVILWNMKTYKLHKRLAGHFNEVQDASFSPDGALLATASKDTRVIIWDVLAGELKRIIFHSREQSPNIFLSGCNPLSIENISFAPNGQHLVTSSTDGFLRVYDVFDYDVDPILMARNSSTKGTISSCQYSPEGTIVTSFTCGNAVFYNGNHLQVPSLAHLCRMSIRNSLDVEALSYMNLPGVVTSFIFYEEVI